MDILKYYPVLFVIAFFIMLVQMIRINIFKNPKSKKHQKYINSVNNIDSFMNNNPPITTEAQLVDSLSKDNIIYRGVE